MILTICKSQYNREITKDNEINLNWANLVNLVSNPIVSKTKNDAPYFYPYTHKGNKALKVNAHALTALILDIDYDYTIEVFIDNHDFTYALYTSFSHTEEHHRFRVIIPIKKPLPFEVFDTKWFRTWMMSKFPFNDKATLKFQGYYTPNTPDISTYQYHCNRGRLFDFDDYKDEMEVLRKRIEKLDKIKKARRDSKTAEFKNRRPKVPDVSNNPKVTEYTHAPVSSTGYGVLSFRALAVCVASGDDKTLEEVIDKMRLDSFSEQEITRAINNCRKR